MKAKLNKYKKAVALEKKIHSVIGASKFDANIKRDVSDLRKLKQHIKVDKDAKTIKSMKHLDSKVKTHMGTHTVKTILHKVSELHKINGKIAKTKVINKIKAVHSLLKKTVKNLHVKRKIRKIEK